MLVRIVKLSFNPTKTTEFLANFDSQKHNIRKFKGCKRLELYRDRTNPNIFFTYSYWDSENDLEMYRNSNLFKAVWSVTKPLFNDKPEAWSVDKLVVLD